MSMILVFGIGNPLRGDDGIGPWVVEQLERRSIPQSDCRSWQQLPLELLEDLGDFQKTIVVDCATSGKPLQFNRLEAGGMQFAASSHSLSPQSLIHWARTLYHFEPEIWLCTIRGSDFELGNTFTPDVLKSGMQAVETIQQFIQQESNHHA